MLVLEMTSVLELYLYRMRTTTLPLHPLNGGDQGAMELSHLQEAGGRRAMLPTMPSPPEHFGQRLSQKSWGSISCWSLTL